MSISIIFVIGIPAIIALVLLISIISHRTKITIKQHIEEYIIEKLVEKGFTEKQLEQLEIVYDDQIELFGNIFISIYRYDGMFCEVKVPDRIPVQGMESFADLLLQEFYQKVGVK